MPPGVYLVKMSANPDRWYAYRGGIGRGVCPDGQPFQLPVRSAPGESCAFIYCLLRRQACQSPQDLIVASRITPHCTPLSA